MVDAVDVPAMIVGDVEIEVEFEVPTPMISRAEELNNVDLELGMGTITKEMAIKILHPDYSEDIVSEIMEANASMAKMLINPKVNDAKQLVENIE